MWPLRNKNKKMNPGGFPPGFSYADFTLEQAGDFAVSIHIDINGSRNLGQAGHGHNAAHNNNNEAGTCRQANVTNIHGKAFRCSQQGGIITEGILGLCNAYRQVAVAQLFDFGQCLLSGSAPAYILCTVNLLSNGENLVCRSDLELHHRVWR